MCSASRTTRYILTLTADANWPDERLVPEPDVLEHELNRLLSEPVVVRAQRRAYNPTASGKRFYELEAGQSISATELTDILVRHLDHLQDSGFLGTPIQVILCASNGELVSKGTAHPGPQCMLSTVGRRGFSDPFARRAWAGRCSPPIGPHGRPEDRYHHR
jgi:hypothetical protein